MIRRALSRFRYELTMPLPQRAVQVINSVKFKKFFLDYLRTHRLHFPESNAGLGVDFGFIEYCLNDAPPDEYLFGVLAEAVKLLNEEYRANGSFDALAPGLRPLYDYNNHYLLLTAIGTAVRAQKIVEVGTASGSSLWAWLRSPHTERVDTWDILPLSENKGWFQTPEIRAVVEAQLENDQRWTQRIENLIDPGVWASRREIFAGADIIWIDGPHDPATFEVPLLGQILELKNDRDILLVFDDIQLSDMLDFWRHLPLPKLNVTSFGHQSGTGLALLRAYAQRVRTG